MMEANPTDWLTVKMTAAAPQARGKGLTIRHLAWLKTYESDRPCECSKLRHYLSKCLRYKVRVWRTAHVRVLRLQSNPRYLDYIRPKPLPFDFRQFPRARLSAPIVSLLVRSGSSTGVAISVLSLAYSMRHNIPRTKTVIPVTCLEHQIEAQRSRNILKVST